MSGRFAYAVGKRMPNISILNYLDFFCFGVESEIGDFLLNEHDFPEITVLSNDGCHPDWPDLFDWYGIFRFSKVL